jgi:prevent-host-death family protein
MEKKISIGELKRDLSGVINQAAYGQHRIIIVSRGKPKAAIVSLEELERLRQAAGDVEDRNRAWLARADALRQRTARRQEDSVALLRELREERLDDILGVP